MATAHGLMVPKPQLQTENNFTETTDCIVTHQNVRRKSGMLLELRDYEDGDRDPESGNSSRRPSTSSLSRYRSCPQLAAALVKQDSPGSDMLTITEPENTVSPEIQQFPYADSERSSTPTPPSTPGSRRSNRSYNHNRQSGWDPSSPSSTPKLNRRLKRDKNSSNESAQRDLNFRLPLRDESLNKFDKRRDRDSKTFSDVYDSPPEVSIDYRFSETSDDDSIRFHGHNHITDDGRDKCERWLQTLKLSNADRIKSRSQMHLPPI